jgi:AcrR family transcriptional regulator
MAHAQTARARWIEEGLRALGRGGPGAVRVEALAERLGVTKGGFYWQFADRQELLDELLAAWERAVVDAVIDEVDRGGGPERDRLGRLFAIAGSRRDLHRVDLAVRDWARHDAAVARRLRRVDDRRMEYMRSLFRGLCADDDEVEARCLLVFALFTGSPFIAAGHRGRRRDEVVQMALARLLAS